MSRVKLFVVLVPTVVLLLGGVLLASGHLSRDDIQYYVPWSVARLLYPSGDDFAPYETSLKQGHWIYDVGIADANGDGVLDIFTSNHNWRQLLLLADGQGDYHDVLSAWGLDQSREFPGIEISNMSPIVKNPGVYIYWYKRHLHIRTHHADVRGPIHITLHALTELEIISNEGFNIDQHDFEVLSAPLLTESTMQFSTTGDATMVLYPRSRGVSMDFRVDETVPLAQIYIGNQLVTPRTHEFSLPLQDRHALAWNDYNDDGQLDIFITRGAVGGTLRIYPADFAKTVNEEFFVSRPPKTSAAPQFDNIIWNLDIRKNGCSARHASWVDFDRDGLLDLFINCEDVGHIEGQYPNKLYRQDSRHQFTDVARQTGLEILNNNIIDYEWFDADNDGDMDLFAHQDNGFWLYRNDAGHFEPEFVYRGKFARIDNPQLKGASGAYWAFDGKLSVSDYDGDGDLDVFSSSKKGNALLINEGGGFVALDPAMIGLPANSVSASWVDFDNDGTPDIHTVPGGIFRQRDDHSFEPTNLLILPSNVYMAAIINWYDLNNDGTRDALIALNQNQTLHRWWEPATKDTFLWEFQTYLNRNSENHWLQIKLVGGAGNREAIGARVTLSTPDGQQIQEVGINDGAFYSQGHYRMYFGLGPDDKADAIDIRWPDGETQELKNVTTDTLLVIKKDN